MEGVSRPVHCVYFAKVPVQNSARARLAIRGFLAFAHLRNIRGVLLNLFRTKMGLRWNKAISNNTLATNE